MVGVTVVQVGWDRIALFHSRGKDVRWDQDCISLLTRILSKWKQSEALWVGLSYKINYWRGPHDHGERWVIITFVDFERRVAIALIFRQMKHEENKAAVIPPNQLLLAKNAWKLRAWLHMYMGLKSMVSVFGSGEWWQIFSGYRQPPSAWERSALQGSVPLGTKDVQWDMETIFYILK